MAEALVAKGLDIVGKAVPGEVDRRGEAAEGAVQAEQEGPDEADEERSQRRQDEDRERELHRAAQELTAVRGRVDGRRVEEHLAAALMIVIVNGRGDQGEERDKTDDGGEVVDAGGRGPLRGAVAVGEVVGVHDAELVHRVQAQPLRAEGAAEHGDVDGVHAEHHDVGGEAGASSELSGRDKRRDRAEQAIENGNDDGQGSLVFELGEVEQHGHADHEAEDAENAADEQPDGIHRMKTERTRSLLCRRGLSVRKRLFHLPSPPFLIIVWTYRRTAASLCAALQRQSIGLPPPKRRSLR